MSIPRTQRVIYERNQLQQVVCQLRFPAILRIGHDDPVAFQNAVQHLYPDYQRAQIEIPGLSGHAAEAVGQASGFSLGTPHHIFASTDGCWNLTLARGSLGLMSRDYRNWTHFKERLSPALDALAAQYHPSAFVRVGLRYQNAILRSPLGLLHTDWKHLIRSELLGGLASEDIGDDLEQFSGMMVLPLGDEMRVAIRYGLARETVTGELGFIIDNDLYTEGRIDVSQSIELLDRLNEWSGWVFRWCLLNKLHHALGPQPAD